MAFFRIKDCDADRVEQEILHSLENRGSRWKLDAKPIEELEERHGNLFRMLRRIEKEIVFELDDRIEGLHDYTTALRKWCEEQEKLLEGQKRLVEAQKQHIDAIYSTLSWRITKPIRALKQIFPNKP